MDPGDKTGELGTCPGPPGTVPDPFMGVGELDIVFILPWSLTMG